MVLANIVLLVFTFLLLLIASYSDLKTRTISNKLILFFLVFGLISNILFAFFLKDYSSLLILLLSVIISIVLFFILWELGAIAGGDVKLFIAIGCLIPTLSKALNLFNIAILDKASNLPIFTILLFLASVLMVLPWLLLYSTYLLFLQKKYISFAKEIFSKRNLVSIFDSIIVISLVNLILFAFRVSNFLYILLATIVFTNLLFYIKVKKQFYYLILGLYCLVLIFTYNRLTIELLTSTLSTIIVICLLSIILIFVKFIKKNIFVETKKISQLKEGDLPVNNYYYIKGKLIIRNPGFFKKILELAKGTYYKNLKIDAHKACGISNKDISFLKDMYKHKLIDNNIYLKKTIPFTPAILLAYILLILF